MADSQEKLQQHLEIFKNEVDNFYIPVFNFFENKTYDEAEKHLDRCKAYLQTVKGKSKIDLSALRETVSLCSV